MQDVLYLQQIADIADVLDNIISWHDDETINMERIPGKDYHWDLASLQEEHDAMRYLIACDLGVTREITLSKPGLPEIIRAFQRRLDFALYVKQIYKKAYNYAEIEEACLFYIKEFSEGNLYIRLPNEIPSFKQKYGKDLEHE